MWENVHPPKRVTCHMSCVTCHVSHVMCHVSRVTCHMSHVTIFFLFSFSFLFGQSGEVYQWRVCYQRGLPRLVCIWNQSNVDNVRVSRGMSVAVGVSDSCKVTCDMWQLEGDMWHVTCTMWHVTCDMWHIKISTIHKQHRLFYHAFLSFLMIR